MHIESNRYPGQIHTKAGTLLFLAAMVYLAIELAQVFRDFSIRCSQEGSFIKAIKSYRTRGLAHVGSDQQEERIALAEHMEADDEDFADGRRLSTSSTLHNDREDSRVLFTAPWAIRTHDLPITRTSSGESTLHGSSSPNGSQEDGHEDLMFKTHHHQGSEGFGQSHSHHRTSRSTLSKLGIYAYHFFTRCLVPWSFIVNCFGVIVYTGAGRGGFLPSLAAHLIKGSIFFGYGILTFARYIGAWSEYGWAWNSRPSHKKKSRVPSAEMIESFVIFLYGISNTWLERLGAAPGSPYTVKQVQHISIAVMFWFAGMIGMALESKWVRLALTRGSSVLGEHEHAHPRSYAFSFNPFPALVIGVVSSLFSLHCTTITLSNALMLLYLIFTPHP